MPGEHAWLPASYPASGAFRFSLFGRLSLPVSFHFSTAVAGRHNRVQPQMNKPKPLRKHFILRREMAAVNRSVAIIALHTLAIFRRTRAGSARQQFDRLPRKTSRVLQTRNEFQIFLEAEWLSALESAPAIIHVNVTRSYHQPLRRIQQA